jgi:hypothetical protein
MQSANVHPRAVRLFEMSSAHIHELKSKKHDPLEYVRKAFCRLLQASQLPSPLTASNESNKLQGLWLSLSNSPDNRPSDGVYEMWYPWPFWLCASQNAQDLEEVYTTYLQWGKEPPRVVPVPVRAPGLPEGWYTAKIVLRLSNPEVMRVTYTGIATAPDFVCDLALWLEDLHAAAGVGMLTQERPWALGVRIAAGVEGAIRRLRVALDE